LPEHGHFAALRFIVAEAKEMRFALEAHERIALHFDKIAARDLAFGEPRAFEHHTHAVCRSRYAERGAIERWARRGRHSEPVGGEPVGPGQAAQLRIDQRQLDDAPRGRCAAIEQRGRAERHDRFTAERNNLDAGAIERAAVRDFDIDFTHTREVERFRAGGKTNRDVRVGTMADRGRGEGQFLRGERKTLESRCGFERP
jgi:hypothetical protein